MKYFIFSDVHGYYSLLKNELEKKGFDINPLITYENLLLKESLIEKPKHSKPITLIIYADKFTIKSEESKPQTFDFNDITQIDLTFNNHLIFTISNKKSFIIKGKDRDNLYVMKDLVKLNKN